MARNRDLDLLIARRRRVVLGDTGGLDAPEPDPPGNQLLLEDGTFLLLERPAGPNGDYLLLEDSP